MSRRNHLNQPEPDISFEHLDSVFEVYDLEGILSPERLETKTLFDAKLSDVHVFAEQRNIYDKEDEPQSMQLNYWVEFYDGLNRVEKVQTTLRAVEQSIADSPESDFKCILFGSCEDEENTTAVIEFKTGSKFAVTIDYIQQTVGLTNSFVSDEYYGADVSPEAFNEIAPETYFEDFGTLVMLLTTAATPDIGDENRIYSFNVHESSGMASVRRVGAEATKGNAIVVYESAKQAEPSEPSLSDIAMNDDVAQVCGRAIESIRNRAVIEKWGGNLIRGLLIYGEPGTGKTTLGRAIASELGAELKFVQCTDVINMWVGKSAEQLKGHFSKANKSSLPYVLLFDEFDSVFATGNQGVRESIEATFRQEIDNLSPNVIVIGTTNNPDRIDPALQRPGRFTKLYVELPDAKIRKEIVHKQINHDVTYLEDSSQNFRIYSFPDMDVDLLARETEGMSGATIVEAFRQAKTEKALAEIQSGELQTPISHQDILRAINFLNRS